MSSDSLWSDYVDEYDDREELKCNRCGSTNVYWSERSGYWRLYEDEGSGLTLHSCEKATADDFDEVID
jgi:cation diffusion facilitator CzcD-associated flavoprotein CzcO